MHCFYARTRDASRLDTIFLSGEAKSETLCAHEQCLPRSCAIFIYICVCIIRSFVRLRSLLMADALGCTYIAEAASLME